MDAYGCERSLPGMYSMIYLHRANLLSPWNFISTLCRHSQMQHVKNWIHVAKSQPRTSTHVWPRACPPVKHPLNCSQRFTSVSNHQGLAWASWQHCGVGKWLPCNVEWPHPQMAGWQGKLLWSVNGQQWGGIPAQGGCVALCVWPVFVTNHSPSVLSWLRASPHTFVTCQAGGERLAAGLVLDLSFLLLSKKLES